jgi:hypothetical protein
VLVSFDVVSLFTKVPVDLAIKVATKRLRQDVTLLQRTSLPVEDIIDLLSQHHILCVGGQLLSIGFCNSDGVTSIGSNC